MSEQSREAQPNSEVARHLCSSAKQAAGLAPAAELEQVVDVRTLGGIGVIELREAVDLDAVQPMFVERGVWVRPLGKLVYATPPLIMNAPDVSTLSAAMVDVVRQL